MTWPTFSGWRVGPRTDRTLLQLGHVFSAIGYLAGAAVAPTKAEQREKELQAAFYGWLARIGG